MTSYVNGATAPWILGGLGVFVLFTLIKIYLSWREVKRSPYFFLRQQAEKRLQNYLWTTAALILLGGGTFVYAGQAPPDNTLRMAIISSAKPVEAADAGAGAGSIPVISLAEADELTGFTDSTLTVSVPLEGPLERDAAGSASATPVLPEEFDQFEPTAELTEDSQFTPLVFSSEINDDYDPVSPRRSFPPGFFTIYATFDYEGMADGMEWAWVWRRDGEVVNGGNELWDYGDDGPGWIYYEPPEGFSPGEYTLEVWVNGELFQQASLTVEAEAARQ